MPSYSFSKLIPGGNATILLTDPALPPEQLPEIAARLMDPMHIQAEQVGALYSETPSPFSVPGRAASLPHLQMMGGEFCVNATRCAALLLARQGRLAPLLSPLARANEPTPAWSGELTVSGMNAPVRVLVATGATALEAALFPAGSAEPDEGIGLGIHVAPARHASLHCAARIACGPSDIRLHILRAGVTLASLSGIQHLLVDAARHPLPDMLSPAWKKASAQWRADSGIAGSPASGVVWYTRESNGYRIWPAVEVLATGSEHLESACGSASLAMAFAGHAAGDGSARLQTPTQSQNSSAFVAVDIIQPSNETLRIFLMPSGNPEGAWIAGRVRLAAEGTAHV